MADARGYRPLAASAPPRRRKSCCSTAVSVLVSAACCLFLGGVVILQLDLYRMRVVDASDLVSSAPGNVTAAQAAHVRASPLYRWLAHGSPKELLAWEALAAGAAAERPWIDADRLGHCGPKELELLLSSQSIDKDRCGPFGPPEPGCAAGFYQPERGAAPRACPPGFFCPEDLVCFVACLYGATCTRANFSETLGWCTWLVRVPHSPKTGPYTAADGSLTCPGLNFLTPCPPGYFCEDPTKKPELCPRGSYCAEGSFAPQRCPIIATCGVEGLDSPDVSAAAAGSLLLAFSFFCALFHSSRCVRDRLRQLRDELRHQRSARHRASMDGSETGTALEATSRTCSRLEATFLDVEADDPSDDASVSHGRQARDGSLELSSTARLEAPTVPFQLRSLSVKRPGLDRVDLEFDQLGLELASTGCCGGRRRVLHGVTGSLRAGRVAAVMGPSGAGKTTLLNVLSGRWDRRARLSGRVRVNGDSALSLKSLSPLVAFVPQEDIMCRELTVRELLEFSAAARLPAACTQARRRAVVNDVLRVLKLVGIRHAVVGDELRRGISGGQRKRVNVGMELVADPSLLFADEPTSGLDSATSLDVMHAFHDVARRGATVAVVLHQPSMQIYAAFDDVLLLAAAGRTAYLGAPSGAKKWFTSLGIRFPSDWAPPDYFMQILAPHLGEDALDLAAEWARRHPPDELRQPVDDGALPPLRSRSSSRSSPGFGRQLWLQLSRAWLQQRRSVTGFIGDVSIQTFAGAGLGLLYVDYSFKDLQLVNQMVAIALGMTITLAAVPTFGSDRAVFLRECGAAGGGGLSTLAHFAAKCTADAPRIAALSTVFVAAFYPLAQPRCPVGVYALICGANAFASSGFGYVASAVLAPASAQLGALCIALIFAMFAGIHPTVRQMPLPLKVVHYSSHDRYFVETLFVEEITRMTEAYRMPPSFYGDGAASSVLAQLLGYGYLVQDTSVYWDHHRLRNINLATMIAFGIGSRILAYVLLVHGNAAALGRDSVATALKTVAKRALRRTGCLRPQKAKEHWRFALR